MDANKLAVGTNVTVKANASGSARHYGNQTVKITDNSGFPVSYRVIAHDGEIFVVWLEEIDLINADLNPSVNAHGDPVIYIDGEAYELASYGAPYSDGSRPASLRLVSEGSGKYGEK